MNIKKSYKDTEKAFISNKNEYQRIYNKSIENPDEFWTETAERISWFKKWDKVSDVDYSKAHIQWFEGGKLNACYNCLDRHVENGKGDDIALIWEGNNPLDDKKFTYQELLNEVSKFSNVLKSNDIKKGDRVCIYMQMIPELAIAMLACARIGAVHSIVFGAFSSNSLEDRINDSKCKMLITQDTGVRGIKNNIPMKENCDKALSECPSIKNVIIVKRTGSEISFTSNRDIWWHKAMENSTPICKPEIMNAEDPLFILYTSGINRKAKRSFTYYRRLYGICIFYSQNSF